jgi:hypothetical protein
MQSVFSIQLSAKEEQIRSLRGLGRQLIVVRCLTGKDKRFAVLDLAGLSERVQGFVH